MTLTKHKVKREALKDFLHEEMPISGGETTSEVWVWRDVNGDIRRVEADYPNGFRVKISLSAVKDDMQFVTARKGSLKLVTMPKGKSV